MYGFACVCPNSESGVFLGRTTAIRTSVSRPSKRPPVAAGFRSDGRDVRFPAPATVSSIVLGGRLRAPKLKCIAYEDEADEDDDLCPVDCVKEFKTDEELFKTLEKAKETNSLVVVDFFRTSCGSCKYIEQGFSKLCKVSGDQQAGVLFLKHNVMDEYDEQSETADRLRIKVIFSFNRFREFRYNFKNIADESMQAVPLFHFYKNGILLEAFATRDKERIDEAIRKYTSSSPRPA